jgi:hypothetical protein
MIENILFDRELLKINRARVLKNFAKNLLSGNNVMNISLPVTVFEPKSFLDRVSD